MSSYLSLFQMSLNQTNFASFAQTAYYLKQRAEEYKKMPSRAVHRNHQLFSNELNKMYKDVMNILCKIKQIADDLGQRLTCYVRIKLPPYSDTQSRRKKDYVVLQYLKTLLQRLTEIK